MPPVLNRGDVQKLTRMSILEQLFFLCGFNIAVHSFFDGISKYGIGSTVTVYRTVFSIGTVSTAYRSLYNSVVSSSVAFPHTDIDIVLPDTARGRYKRNLPLTGKVTAAINTLSRTCSTAYIRKIGKF